MRRVAIALIALQCLGLSGLSQSYAATPKPKPTPKITSAKKVVVHHTIYRKPVLKSVQPSPSPSWPPAGFASYGSAYARIPTGAELVGILSAMKSPATAIDSCAKDPKHPTTAAYSCAAILVAATEKCTWWEITSTITGVDPINPPKRIPFGKITTYTIGAVAKKIQTIFLVSPIPLQTGVKFTAIHALCGKGPATARVPSTSFAPVPIASIASAPPVEMAASEPTPTTSLSPTPSP